MFKWIPITLSALALAVSAGSLWFSFLNFRSGALPPVVSTRLNEFVLTDNPVAVSASFDFSVTNYSSRPLFIVKCEVATDGLNGGAGGYAEWFSPCGIEKFATAKGLELASGQTEFFTVKYSQNLDSYDASLALGLMGIELKDIQNSLLNGPCAAKIYVSRTGSAMNQNCNLVTPVDFPEGHKPKQKVSFLVLQTGTGDLIRTPLYLSMNQPWPWGN